MSAECSKCGADVTYPEGTWPLGRCRLCDLEKELVALREANVFLENFIIEHGLHDEMIEAAKK